jgi:acyl-CoA synthetase (AMP-forming)/AMP-acid ligase II
MSTFYDLFFAEGGWNKTILTTNASSCTVADLHDRVEYYRTLLNKQGEVQGKKVGCLIPSVIDYTALMVAVNMEGGIFVPLSWQLRNDDLSNVLELIDPHVVFTVERLHGFSFGQVIRTWAQESQKETVLFIQPDSGERGDQPTVIQGAKRELETEAIDVIACTSGSTGVPKGIKLTVDAIHHWTEANAAALGLTSADCVLSTIPASVPYGICWLLTAFRYRFHMVIPEWFDLPLIVQLAKNHLCNKAVSTPSLFKAIYRFAKSAAPSVIDHFEVCGLAGEPVNQEFISLVFGMKGRLLSLYGLSEQGLLMYTNDIRSDVVKWTVCEGIQYKIDGVDSQGVGEILFHTPSAYSGYYKRPDLTREVYTEDGWFYTGDLVKVNEHQEIEIVGRKKELIKKAGQQVVPGEIEQILLQHPQIKQAAVVGVPHPVYGEQVVAFVVAAGELDIQDVYAFAAERIAGYKVPDVITRIDQMPINQGKLDKVTLRKWSVS